MRILLLVIFVFCLLGCASVAVKDLETYRHKSGKFDFPVNLANLKRVEIEKFDKSGRDIGVTYNADENLSLVVTIYAYPTPKNENGKIFTLIENFETINQVILVGTPNSKKVKWPESLPMWSDEGVSGILQAYDLGGNGAVISLLQIYDYGFWTLKFRSTFKADDREKAIEEIRAIHSEFKW